MTSRIAKNIQALLDKQNISAYALEKRLGLNINVIGNIISGKSKNPSIDTVKLISDALNWSLDELYSDDLTSQSKLNSAIQSRISNKNVKNSEKINLNLVKLCIDICIKLINQHNKVITKPEFFSLIDAVYNFSFGLENKLDEVTINRFTEWFIEQNI